ncbi:MAG: hypothetical protein IKX95_09270 [Lachnospiraceae bacterium]|nr:hypothetical protein [Lachnospiraceae bacterium]MBR6470016.1 hypothetical protein [Lachnospiraceae bacterium]MBR6485936.1 hypothetical protein [Lachnospiraceae bacterium]
MTSNVRITLFGKFAIYKDGKPILENLSNTRKTKLFLCYLLLNKDKPISHKELFELLWSGEDYANPGTALRTLLYRYRAMIETSEITALDNSIISRRGAYQWNPDLNVSIDIYDFENASEAALESIESDDNREKALKDAIDLYTGNLLPDSNAEHWVVPKAVKLRDLYIRVALEYIQILKNRNEYNSVIDICNKVHEYIPVSLEIENEMSIAMQKGLESEEMRDQYHKFRSAVKDMDRVIGGVREEMETDSSENTAFVCEYEMFREVYRLQRRLLMRTGETMFLTMVTLRSKLTDRHDPLKNERAMSALLECCKHELRMGDSICRYSEDQYAIMFPVDSYENAVKVMERVRMSFYRKSNLNEYMMVYKICPLKNSKE